MRWLCGLGSCDGGCNRLCTAWIRFMSVRKLFQLINRALLDQKPRNQKIFSFTCKICFVVSLPCCTNVAMFCSKREEIFSFVMVSPDWDLRMLPMALTTSAVDSLLAVDAVDGDCAEPAPLSLMVGIMGMFVYEPNKKYSSFINANGRLGNLSISCCKIVSSRFSGSVYLF